MKDSYEETESPSELPLPPGSPINPSAAAAAAADDEEAEFNHSTPPEVVKTAEQPPSSSSAPVADAREGRASVKGKEEEENMVVPFSGRLARPNPDKMSKMQEILSQFTEEQMTRYESFRRSGFQRSNMKRLLTNITGSQKISVPMTIVVSGIAKMFVGELIETGKTVMMERKESGPVRPCHIREAYRRLKLEGKIPKRSVPRRFR